MSEITISVEAAFSILIGFIGLIVTIAAGYASLRERLKANEIYTAHINKDLQEIKKWMFELMRALNVTPRITPEEKEQ